MLGGERGGEMMPIVNRIYAFAYPVGFQATVAVPVQATRRKEVIHRLEPNKASLVGLATLVREFCLRKRGVAAN